MSYPYASSWNWVLDTLRAERPGTVLRVAKRLLPHPVAAGAVVSLGLPMGQSADYRFALPDCTGLHARDFGTHYEVHIDRIDPSCGIAEHLRQDAPATYVAGAAALGVLFGILLGRSKDAAVSGAGLGALFGVLTLPAAEPAALPGGELPSRPAIPRDNNYSSGFRDRRRTV
jgi:hypothetical protein